MLAQSFKPAADLGITEPQRDALRKTLVLLETGKLKHVDLDDLQTFRRFVPVNKRTFSGDFNMADWSRAHKCGTACCIGGTAEMIGGVEFYEGDMPRELYRLFYPHIGFHRSIEDITTAQAATALRSYLTTGNANWAVAVADQRKHERV